MVGAHDTHAPEALPAGVHGWTAPAMMRLFLAYLADGRIRLDGLTTTVAGEDAAEAYALIDRERGRVLGVELGQCRSVGALPGSAEHQLGCKMLLAQQAILAQALQQNGIACGPPPPPSPSPLRDERRAPGSRCEQRPDRAAAARTSGGSALPEARVAPPWRGWGAGS